MPFPEWEQLRRSNSSGDAAAENQLATRLTKLLAEMGTQSAPYLQRLEVRSQGRIDYVDVSEALWLQADGNYIEVHTTQKTHLARVTITQLESQLDPTAFVRISRSAMVNLAMIRSIKSVGQRDHAVELKSGDELPITRSLSELKARLRFPNRKP